MVDWKNEQEARDEIKELVGQYYRKYKSSENDKSDFKPGNRIAYAARVYDENEMKALTDAMLDFWLTTGRFADSFEKSFAEWIGVKYVHLSTPAHLQI